jgi:hypothetical protein
MVGLQSLDGGCHLCSGCTLRLALLLGLGLVHGNKAKEVRSFQWVFLSLGNSKAARNCRRLARNTSSSRSLRETPALARCLGEH